MMDCTNKAIELLAKEKDYHQKICGSSAYWIPLQWLYVRMVENKDLTRVSEIAKQEKERYWSLVKNIDKPVWVRLQIVQALYVYNFIKEEI